MTNEQIISNRAQYLLSIGKIVPTGRTFTAVDSEGNEITVHEPEAIHTFTAWKELGFMVRKGEKAIDSFSIWKYTSRKKPDQTEEEAQEEGYCFLKLSHFFAAHQVQPIIA
ncbi:MAG: hypothetical protein IJ664_04610 [Clostridia bacterium]|nr:hypothetical protein [Clostridia bacterium]